MHLKSLTIKGFKSFADACTLDLEPGVTVVVGPNGSGKSNVVDAIAWVLGAQAPSAVRSQKMDDVIFAGTSARPALGRAEVSLTIDNTSGMLPIEFTEVTITRTLFRSGESEYALNRTPCRLLDIQELLSDSGVGRQQHVIVSQGQIDGVLNARPEERRLVIEEAAGVLKFRRRKEKSERRLAATEANLTRLQDLLREVRRQLRPLERQADAARRHGALLEEFTALRVFVAGRELAALQVRLDADAAQRNELVADEQALRARLAELDAGVVATEAELTAMGADDLGDVAGRYEAVRERVRGLVAVLAERRRGLERDRDSAADRGVIANLEAEAARLVRDLEEVEREAAELAPLADQLEAAEAELAARRAGFEDQWADGVPMPGGEAAEVRGELAALRSSIENAAREHQRVEGRVAALDEKLAVLAATAEQHRDELARAERDELPLVEELDRAEAEAERARVEAERTEEEHRRSAAQRQVAEARVEALALALDEARSRAGAERLADVSGVVGTLLDLVEVDPGWEAPFEAAAGEALAAVVVDGTAAARAAVAALAGDGLSGAVLPLSVPGPISPPPPVGEPVRGHVRASSARPEVDALLDALLGAAVLVDGGPLDAAEVAVAHPGAVVVTGGGDRFALAGWRVGGGGTGATGAALEDSRNRAAQALEGEAAAGAAAVEARALARAAAGLVAELTERIEDNDRRASVTAGELQRVEADRRDATTELEALRGHLAELGQRLAREETRAGELTALLPDLEATESQAVARGRAMAEARARLDEKATEVGALRTDLRSRGAGVDERRGLLGARLAEIEQRLAQDVERRAAAEERRIELANRLVATDRLAARVLGHQDEVEAAVAELRERRRRQSEAARAVSVRLEELRRDRTEAEASLEQVRERLQRIEIDQAEIRLRVETAVESLRRELDTEPEVALAATCPPLPEGQQARARVRELERELRALGTINPLALEEYDALLERHRFLEEQLEDVRTSRRELAKVIRAIDAEIVSVFSAAFVDVAANFEHLFQTLFPGGSGSLKLTDPQNLLETGIEVEARPSGKNVKKLSLLSGGERSLTALAYLFAVFRSRPSPFYVMDEVEAALDDVNLHRFLGLVEEFRKDAQLLIVSHQKRTMEAADCLYGVSMQPGGSSKVVSEKASAA